MNGHSYPEVAARAVARASQQHPSPVFGYLRSGYQEKIYLYNALEDARGWFIALTHGKQPFDYAAVFVAPDFSRPAQGLESFGHTNVSGDPYVGNWVPFLLGLPLGGLAGYFLRSWQEGHPGQALPGIPPGTIPPPKIPAGPGAPPPAPPPKTSGDPYGYAVGCGDMVGGPWVDMMGPQVGGPWVDMVDPQVGGPWVDIVGADSIGAYQSSQMQRYEGSRPFDRRRSLQQTRALIESAKSQVAEANAARPAAVWVWILDESGPSTRPGVEVTPLPDLQPYASMKDAYDAMVKYGLFQAPHIAMAMFDTTSTHWPNPVRWSKSNDPAHEPMIAFYLSQYGSARTAGDYGGTTIGAALDDVRERAQSIANKRAGNVVGVIHKTQDNTWHALAFLDEDTADDWITEETKNPSTYTYAAYFNKRDATWPNPIIESVSGMRSPPGTALPRKSVSGTDMIGVTGPARAALEGLRNKAQQLATSHTPRGMAAAGVIFTADGLWHALGINSLDEAIDWLQKGTREKSSFIYAAAFEKDSDGRAYFQAEEVGERTAPSQPREVIHRDVATTSGDDYGYTVGGPWVDLYGWAA